MAKEYEENFEENLEQETTVIVEKRHPIKEFIERHPRGCAIAAAVIGTVLGAIVGVEVFTRVEEPEDDDNAIDVDATEVSNDDSVQTVEF